MATLDCGRTLRPRPACKAGPRRAQRLSFSEFNPALGRRVEPRDASGVAACTQPGWKPHQALRSAWPAVYACMGVAAWLVWRRGGLAAQAAPLAAYLALLAASWLAWPPLFGGGHPLPRAYADALGAPLPAPRLTLLGGVQLRSSGCRLSLYRCGKEAFNSKEWRPQGTLQWAMCIACSHRPCNESKLIQEAGRSAGRPGRGSGGGVPRSGPGRGAAAAALCRLDLLCDRAGQLRAGLRRRRGARRARACPRCLGLHWSAQQRAAAGRPLHSTRPPVGMQRWYALPAHVLLPKSARSGSTHVPAHVYHAGRHSRHARAGTGAPSEEPDLAGYATPGARR